MRDSAGNIGPLGVVGVNSPAFATTIFESLAKSRVCVILRRRDDEERMHALGITEVIEPEAGGGWVDVPRPENSDDEVAQIAFTSGTEGQAKGVALTHRGLSNVSERLNLVMEVDETIREYVGVPIYHSFGLGRCRAIFSAGGRAYIPAKGFNPGEIAELLEQDKINALSAVPSLWRILLQSRKISPSLAQKIRWIEIGSQYMARSEKEELRTLFSNAIIVQHFGLTEASRSTFLEVHKAHGNELESVGKALHGVEVKINAKGIIAVRGPHVGAYKVLDGVKKTLVDGDGWLATSDLGKLQDGFLYFLGRADDIINCGGLKLSPDLLERRIEKSLSMNSPIVVTKIPDSLRGETIGIVVTHECELSESTLIQAGADAAEFYGVNAKRSIRLLRVQTLPQTAAGKIQRKKLSQQFSEEHRQQAQEFISHPASRGAQKSVGSIYRKQLGLSETSVNDTFVNLGGDSLDFIQTSIALESLLGRLPANWENTRLVDLESLPHEQSARWSVEPLIWLRALVILAIASNSAKLFGTFSLPAGAYFLLVLAGISFARFQLNRLRVQGRARSLLSTLPKLIVPVLAILGLEQLKDHTLRWDQWLFVSNLISPQRGGFWFINVWVQIYIGLFILFSLPSPAKALSKNPVRGAFVVLAFATLLTGVAPHIYDTSHLYDRVPQSLFWLFALGWSMWVGRESHRLLLTFLCLVLPLILFPLFHPAALWVVFLGWAFLYLPPLRLPPAIARTITSVSAASLYIYIFKDYVVAIVNKLMPAPFAEVAPFIAWLGAIVLGVILLRMSDAFWSFSSKKLQKEVSPARQNVPTP